MLAVLMIVCVTICSGSFPMLKNQAGSNEGEMRETNNPMDMALRGEAFLLLQNQNNESVYTRDGQFYLNAEGVMVNSMGHEFSDPAGGPTTFKRYLIWARSPLIRKA